MRKDFLALVTFLSLTFTTLGHAGLLVEPILGYNLGTEVSTRGKDYTGGSGMAYGGRLGFQKGPLQAGLDYLNSSIDMSSGDFDDDINSQEYGAFFGFEFPILFRAYGAYIFSAHGDTKINSNSVSLDSGSGYKLGLGFTLLPFVDLNLDYRKVGFDKKIDIDTFMFSASLPFNLF